MDCCVVARWLETPPAEARAFLWRDLSVLNADSTCRVHSGGVHQPPCKSGLQKPSISGSGIEIFGSPEGQVRELVLQFICRIPGSDKFLKLKRRDRSTSGISAMRSYAASAADLAS